MDEYDIEFLIVVFGTILSVVLGILFIAYIGVGITVGQVYQTTGYVRMYEQSSWIGPHTWVVLETYGGTEASITLVGYHDFDLGKAYTFKTICRRGWVLGLANWYEVTDIYPHEEAEG